MANPFAGVDQGLAAWFHSHLTHTFITMLRAFSEFGAAELIGVALFFLVSFFVWKRWWPSVVTLIVAVPGGMLLNEWVKILVHRHRPFLEGPFVDWSGYSFASGHTIGATLLYGQLALFVLPAMKTRRMRALTISMATLLVILVGFSRIALGAHYLTDVLAGIVLGLAWLSFCLVILKPMRRSVVLPTLVPEIAPEISVAIPVPIENAEPPVLNRSV